MTVFLIITILGVFLLGYLFMHRLDAFLQGGSIPESPQARANQGVLIYGSAEVATKIKHYGIKCRTLETLSFPEDGFFSALFALSADDCSNLAICHAAKCTDPGIMIIARCNTPQLRGIFEAEGVASLLDPGESIDGFLAQLWEGDQ